MNGKIGTNVRADMKMGVRDHSEKEYYVVDSIGSKRKGVEIHPVARR